MFVVAFGKICKVVQDFNEPRGFSLKFLARRAENFPLPLPVADPGGAKGQGSHGNRSVTQVLWANVDP